MLQHSIVASTAGDHANHWRFQTSRVNKPLRIRPRLTVSTNDAAIEAAVAGFGITRVLSYQIAPQLSNGELGIIMEKYEPPPRPIHILHREGRYESAKVRAFVDLLAERLRADSALN